MTTAHMKPLYLCCCIALACAACRRAEPALPKAPVEEPEFSPYAETDTATYTLLPSGDSAYTLKNRRNGKTYEIPLAMLTPPATQEELEPQLDLKYGPLAAAMPGGEGLLCFYLSSYEIAEGGSLALAEGYDVFLLLDTVNDQILPGVLNLGQTRGRHKSMGYMEATYTRFYVSRPRREPACWIGTRKERVYLDWDDETLAIKGGPYHDIGPLKWYRFDGTKWAYDPTLDRLLPMGKGAGELPPTTPLTPIDVALDAYRKRNF